MMAKHARREIGKLIAKLSAEAVESLYELAQQMFAGENAEARPCCPYCGSESVVKNGHKCHKQEYLCKNCRKTFVLDSYKGGALPEEVTRKAKKHGEKAEKRGTSNEYVCICTGAQRRGGVIAETVNRAKPSSEEIQAVFGGHIFRVWQNNLCE